MMNHIIIVNHHTIVHLVVWYTSDYIVL
jgi:hypothetical protein